MKIKICFMFLFLCSNFMIQAQDNYHTTLQNSLQNNFGLPAGSWVFNNTEAANLNSDYVYGAVTASNQTTVMQPFAQKVNIVVNSAGTNAWDAGYGMKNINTINNGDACLLIVWLRAATGTGHVTLFVENASTYDKEVLLTTDLSDQWTQFMVPFEANTTYAPNGLTTGLHLAWQTQTIEVGGLAMLNYHTAVNAEDLPSDTNNEQYGGWEPDAPWRAEAANRIEQIRKANLTVRVEDAEGNPIPDASVQVEMLRHDYAFGTAVVSRFFAGNNSQNDAYESKMLDLDGEGHGFNWVVFENGLKWPGWENNWNGPKTEKANAAQWLIDHDIKIRGHNLLWPGWSNLPNDIQQNQNNHQYIRDRINNHIEEIVTYPGIAGNIAEWDVLNEITTNRDLEYTFQGDPGYPTGREIYRDVFQKLDDVDPNTKTYYNDYVTISQANAGGGLYDLKKQFIHEMIDAGVKLDGIGFQGHIGGFPTSINAVYNILEDFHNTFGLKAKITEYDTNPAMSDDLCATYLRDFLTIIFSHESTDGFMMWGFWDGAHWHQNAPMFRQDWSLKPAGQTFIDMVFNEWWTNASGQTDPSGEFKVRGFKGKYKISVDAGTGVMTDTIEMLTNVIVVKTGEAPFVVANQSIDKDPSFKIYPNPARDFINIEKSTPGNAMIRIIDMTGRVVFSKKMKTEKCTIPLNFGAGIYEVMLEGNGKIYSEKIMVQ